MGLGRLCHFFLEIAKSKSPRQGIFIYVSYDYWGQCLSEFSHVVSSSLIWIGVPFLTGVCIAVETFSKCLGLHLVYLFAARARVLRKKSSPFESSSRGGCSGGENPFCKEAGLYPFD